ncbi:MAG TPA: ABC transporter permease [Chloroflexota bacterium]|nr:ABC transporter permease [Chloroflexota bacterium]
MKAYIARRFLYMLLLLLMGSMVSFMIITLPPGDYLSYYVDRMTMAGVAVSEEDLAGMRRYYGLDDPLVVQYAKWLFRVLQGDLGRSFGWNRPVSELIWERLGMTVVVAFGSLIVTYVIAIPIGVYSAVKQYSVADYATTFVGFIGLSVPPFLLALVVMMFFHNNLGLSVGGLFSPEYANAPWSFGKFMDLLAHLPVPLLVIGLSGTAWLIRTMRATLLDELRKPYVQTARAKGVEEWELLRTYPVRVALVPIASTIGWTLPAIFSGSIIVGIVLNLPTIGPLLYSALTTEDMFLAASTVMISMALTLVGTFISDILLAMLDPRIHYT